MPTSSHVHGNRSELKYESAGESGAGKTFTTQKILDFLAEVPVTACSPVSAPAHAQTETGRRKSRNFGQIATVTTTRLPTAAELADGLLAGGERSSR